ncbi:hypothetical protein Y032_0411g957 [Ancylostoma ceylanicum]|nr:hypothetical protein Y032_0411g957 [Ancylostoma ceylanicum]
MLAFIFSSIAYFTNGWAELASDHAFWHYVGLYPWGDIDHQRKWWNQAPWWYLVTWILMTVAFIIQFLTSVAILVVIVKNKNTLCIHKTNLIVSSICCILLSMAMVLWGTKYWKERESSETSGLYVSVSLKLRNIGLPMYLNQARIFISYSTACHSKRLLSVGVLLLASFCCCYILNGRRRHQWLHLSLLYFAKKE